MRQHYHMTQQDLANKTGLARATISRYELGQRSPSIEDTTTILTALHLELTITRDKSDF